MITTSDRQYCNKKWRCATCKKTLSALSWYQYIRTDDLFLCDDCNKFCSYKSCTSWDKDGMLVYFLRCNGWNEDELFDEIRENESGERIKKLIDIYKNHIDDFKFKMNELIGEIRHKLTYPEDICDIGDCEYAVERYNDFSRFVDEIPDIVDPEYDCLDYEYPASILGDYLEYINCYKKLKDGDY